MPSPIAHVSMGYVVYAYFLKYVPTIRIAFKGKCLILLILCAFFSLIPDLDAVPGLLTGDMGQYHNHWTHSVSWGIVSSVLIALVMYSIQRKGFWGWFALVSSCYGLHILMDTLTYGRGCMVLWPFSAKRYKFDPSFFGGLRWSDGFISQNHLWTAIEELSFGILLIATYSAIEFIAKRIGRKTEHRNSPGNG